jgi:hypothetical protein
VELSSFNFRDDVRSNTPTTTRSYTYVFSYAPNLLFSILQASVDIAHHFTRVSDQAHLKKQLQLL